MKKITDKMRVDFMIKNSVTFQPHIENTWKAWGFEGCSLVERQKTKRRALDAAIRFRRAEAKEKRR